MTSVDESCFIIVSPGFPVDESDTTCLPAQQQFIHALNRNFPRLQIIVVTLFHPNHRERYNWSGNIVLSMGGRQYSRLLRPLLWHRAIKKAMATTEGKNVLGVLSFWYSDSAWVGRQIGKQLGVSHKCWILGQDAKANNRFVRLVRPSADELIALSPFLANEFEKNHGIRPAHLVRNSVQMDPIDRLTRERDIHVLGVGSLTRLKQWDIFVDVVAKLNDAVPSLKVLLVGKGPEVDNIKKQIARHQLDSIVTLTGELTHPQVLSVMQCSKVLLHPSSYEGYSGACLEALYAGCHVVSFTQAEDRPIRHWYIVKDKIEMIDKTLDLLQHESDFSRELTLSTNEAVTQMMALFNLDSKQYS